MLESGELVGNGIVPLAYSAENHAGYDAAGITMVDGGVQDFVGTTYRLEGESVTPIEPEQIALEDDGIPVE